MKKTIYTYIEMGLFKDWGVTNLDLRRKVTRKLKKKKLKKRAEPADYTGRKYEDYLEFIKSNPAFLQQKWILIQSSRNIILNFNFPL